MCVLQYLGSNKGAREGCLAIASGTRLTAAQKKAIFRLGDKRGASTPKYICVLRLQGMQTGREAGSIYFNFKYQ